MDPIKSGFVVRNYVSGIILVLIASGVVVADHMVDIPLEIRGFVIPGWSVYVVSALLFIGGVILVAGSGRADRCTTCGKTLVLERVPFSLRDGDMVVHAVRELDADLIENVRKLKEGEPKVILIMDYCRGCRRLAKMVVQKEDKKRSSELVPERIVTGPPVWKFVDRIEQLREKRQKENEMKEAEAKRRES